MTQKPTQNRIVRTLGLMLCALFLLLTLARDFARKSDNDSTLLQSLSSQIISLSAVTKTAPLFPIEHGCSANAVTNRIDESLFNWNILPKSLLVNLAERNIFYITKSINAP